MATKFLDKTGLSHFWGKIKSYVTNLLSLKADDSAVVHLAGAETITGAKTFSSNVAITKGNPILTHKNTSTETTVYPSSGQQDARMNFQDKNGHQLGSILHRIQPTNSAMYLRVFNFNRTDSENAWSDIAIGYDNNGNVYTSAPTPAIADDSTKIATTAWARKATGNFACNAATATKFASAQSVALTGDVTGSASSQAGWSIAATLTNSGVTAGRYTSVSVDAKGRVTAGNVKHSYTTAANAAKNWYRIANANTSQTDTTKPIHAQFILTAYNASYDAGYYERWFVNAEVFGRNAHIIILGNQSLPFSQARILYENTIADLDTNDRPAIDIYLNTVFANGTTKIEIEEVYNSGWTFVNNGQISASSVPTGFESVSCSVRNNGVERSTYADYVSYLNRQISNITAAFTLADSYLYRSRTLNCTGTFTITIPSINSGYMWCVIKNKNTSSGVITLHPSTTSVLIDGSNADITLQPMEYVCIHSAGANNYSLIVDGRWKSQKADKATTLAGYGITDANIANGTITLGSSSITPLTSHQSLANYVTLDGDQIITGKKAFSSAFMDNIKSIVIKNPDVARSITPSNDEFTSVEFVDSTYTAGSGNNSSRIGSVAVAKRSTGEAVIQLIAFNPFTTDDANAAFRVGYDVNGIAFARVPQTSSSRTEASDVVTRGWIPNDERIVHSSGDETINGSKTFSSNIRLNNSSGDKAVVGVESTSNLASYSLRLSAYSSLSNGAHIFLYGKDNTSNPGDFAVVASTGGSSVRKKLQGTSSGTLSWNGNSIQTTSDERYKTHLDKVSDDVLDAWGDVQWGQFQFLDAVESKGKNARLHLGLIAQRVKAVFEMHGLDACAYGILCHEEHEERDDELAVDLWMVRYEEALAMEVAFQRRRAEKAEARIKVLEDRLEALEAKFT